MIKTRLTAVKVTKPAACDFRWGPPPKTRANAHSQNASELRGSPSPKPSGSSRRPTKIPIAVIFTGRPVPADRNWGLDESQVDAMTRRLKQAEGQLGDGIPASCEGEMDSLWTMLLLQHQLGVGLTPPSFPTSLSSPLIRQSEQLAGSRFVFVRWLSAILGGERGSLSEPESAV